MVLSLHFHHSRPSLLLISPLSSLTVYVTPPISRASIQPITLFSLSSPLLSFNALPSLHQSFDLTVSILTSSPLTLAPSSPLFFFFSSVLSSQSLYPSDSRQCPSYSPTWHSAQGPEGQYVALTLPVCGLSVCSCLLRSVSVSVACLSVCLSVRLCMASWASPNPLTAVPKFPNPYFLCLIFSLTPLCRWSELSRCHGYFCLWGF